LARKSTRRRVKPPAGEDHHNGNGVIRGLIAATASLQADVRHLTETVATMTRQWRDQEASASSGRADLHRKIDGVKDDVRRAEASTAQVARDLANLASIKPVVDGLAQARERVIGAGIAAKFVWAFVGGAAASIIGLIAWLVRVLQTIPHG
jgi:Protein of unknown function (DUF1515)